MSHLTDFKNRGWCQFAYDSKLLLWVNTVFPVAQALLSDPAHAKWFRYQDTWFAGVNILPNTLENASVNAVPLQGDCLDFIKRDLFPSDPFLWDTGQLSVCFPGYPKPMATESDGQYRFRKERDAAHVDGLLPFGPERARFAMEWHRFILGIPLTHHPEYASPFCVWEGSHIVMRNAFREAFDGLPIEEWASQDITAVYQETRKTCFEHCQRITIHAKPGECYIADPLILHGMAPWEAQGEAQGEAQWDDGHNQNGTDINDAMHRKGRMIVYFRPELDSPRSWLMPPWL